MAMLNNQRVDVFFLGDDQTPRRFCQKVAPSQIPCEIRVGNGHGIVGSMKKGCIYSA